MKKIVYILTTLIILTSVNIYCEFTAEIRYKITIGYAYKNTIKSRTFDVMANTAVKAIKKVFKIAKRLNLKSVRVQKLKRYVKVSGSAGPPIRDYPE